MDRPFATAQIVEMAEPALRQVSQDTSGYMQCVTHALQSWRTGARLITILEFSASPVVVGSAFEAGFEFLERFAGESGFTSVSDFRFFDILALGGDLSTVLARGALLCEPLVAKSSR